jgi:sugar O-acyltransferase (sialic acid O-acetyltransferase NeuD family)
MGYFKMLNQSANKPAMRVVIKGAGGHGVVVADILSLMHHRHAAVVPVGFIDDDPLTFDKQFLGLKVIGASFADVRKRCDAVIVAIGDNRTRAEKFAQLEKEGARFATCIHPGAVISNSAAIGHGTMICAGVLVNPAARIGVDVILNTGCTVDHHNLIGDHVHIAPGVNLGGNVHVGEGTLVGIGATVLPGRRIGSWSIVAGGSVVTQDVPDGVVYGRS